MDRGQDRFTVARTGQSAPG